MDLTTFLLCCILVHLVWSRYRDDLRQKAQDERITKTEKSVLDMGRKNTEGFDGMRNYVAAPHYSKELHPPLGYQLLSSKQDRFRHDWAVEKAATRRILQQLLSLFTSAVPSNNDAPEESLPGENLPEQNLPQHDFPKYDSPLHDSPERESPKCDSANNVSPDHDTSNPDPTYVDDDEDDMIDEYLHNTARKIPEATADIEPEAPTAEDQNSIGEEVTGKAADADAEHSIFGEDSGQGVSEEVHSATHGCDVAGEEAGSPTTEDGKPINEDSYCTSEDCTTLVEESPLLAKSIDILSENAIPLSTSSGSPIVDDSASTQYDGLSEDEEEDDDASSVEFQTEEADSETTATGLRCQSVQDQAIREHVTSSSTVTCSKDAQETAKDVSEPQLEPQPEPMKTGVAVEVDLKETAIESAVPTDDGQVTPVPEQASSPRGKQQRHVHFSDDTAKHEDAQQNTTVSVVAQHPVEQWIDEWPVAQVVGQPTGQSSEYQSVQQPLEQPVGYRSVAYQLVELQQINQTAPYFAPVDNSLLQPASAEPYTTVQDPSPLNNIDMTDAPDLCVGQICQTHVQPAYEQVYEPPPPTAQLVPADVIDYMNVPRACMSIDAIEQAAIIYQASAQGPQQSDTVSHTPELVDSQHSAPGPEPCNESSATIVNPIEHPTTDAALSTDTKVVPESEDVTTAPEADAAVVAALMAVVQSYEEDVVGTRLMDLGEYMDAFDEVLEQLDVLSRIEDDVKSGAITTQLQLQEELRAHLEGVEKVEADHQTTVADDAQDAQDAHDQWLSEHPWYAEVLDIYETYWKDVGERIDAAGERESYESIRTELVNQQITAPDAMRVRLKEHWQKVLNYETPSQEATNAVVQTEVVVVEDEVNSQWAEYFGEILGKRKSASKGGPLKRCWYECEWSVVLDDYYEPEREFHQDIGKYRGNHVELVDVQPGTELADAMKDTVDSMNMD